MGFEQINDDDDDEEEEEENRLGSGRHGRTRYVEVEIVEADLHSLPTVSAEPVSTRDVARVRSRVVGAGERALRGSCARELLIAVDGRCTRAHRQTSRIQCNIRLSCDTENGGVPVTLPPPSLRKTEQRAISIPSPGEILC